MPDREDGSPERRFLTFRVGARHYALSASSVVEVVHVPALTRIPQSPGALLGIANLRGTVLPVVSVGRLLGLAETALDTISANPSRAIVLQGGARVALVVDRVEALEAIAAAGIQTGQAEMAAESGERLAGAFRLAASGEVVKILDIESILQAAFARRSRHGITKPTFSGCAVTAVDDTSTPTRMLVTFELAGQEFAFDLAVVREVIPVDSNSTAIPHAEAVVLGVTSLRGTLLPLMSLRALLGFPNSARTDREKVVVVDVGGALVGFVVDAARTVVAADERLIDAIPAVLAARQTGESRIGAIYRGDAGTRLIAILATEQLFREDTMQRLRARDQENQLDVPVPQASASLALSLLVFRMGDDEFGLPIEAVDEVAHIPDRITRIPKTPKFLEGVINLRGEVVPVIDLRRRFDMPAAADRTTRRLVVARSEKHRAALIVDSVTGVLRVAAGGIEEAPDLTDDIAALVRGVINLPQQQRIILLLDPSELLTRAERGLLDRFASHHGRILA